MQLNVIIPRNLHETNPNLHKFLKLISPQDHPWKTATTAANHQLKVNCSVSKRSIITGHHGTRTRSDFPLPVRQCAGHTASATGRPQSQVAKGSGLRFHQREGKSRDRRANKSRNSDEWLSQLVLQIVVCCFIFGKITWVTQAVTIIIIIMIMWRERRAALTFNQPWK